MRSRREGEAVFTPKVTSRTTWVSSWERAIVVSTEDRLCRWSALEASHDTFALKSPTTHSRVCLRPCTWSISMSSWVTKFPPAGQRGRYTTMTLSLAFLPRIICTQLVSMLMSLGGWMIFAANPDRTYMATPPPDVSARSLRIGDWYPGIIILLEGFEAVSHVSVTHRTTKECLAVRISRSRRRDGAQIERTLTWQSEIDFCAKCTKVYLALPSQCPLYLRSISSSGPWNSYSQAPFWCSMCYENVAYCFKVLE